MSIKSIFTIKNLGIILIVIGIFSFFLAFGEMNTLISVKSLRKGEQVYEEFYPVTINAGLMALASSIMILSGVQLINGTKKKD